jgi:predicted MFS family arabinose efflux permease
MGILVLGMAFLRASSIYVLALLMSTVNMFFSPAIRTGIPRLVAREKLQTANALYSVTFYTAQLAGPALGGALVGVFGIQSAFILNGVSFLVSAFTEAFIHIPPSKAEGMTGAGQMLRDFIEGFAYIRQKPVVRFVIVFLALTTLPAVGLSIASLVVLREVFGFSEAQYGVLMTINGAGLLAGSMVVGQLKRVSEIPQMVAGTAVYGGLSAVLALSGWLWPVAVLQFGIGIAVTIINVS